MLAARAATADDVRRVHPDATCSFRAWACEMDGELVGVIGLALSRPVAWLFCWFDERLRPYLRSMTVMKLLKKVDLAIRGTKIPVMAIRDRNERKAPHILKRLGFRFWALIDGDPVYMWEGSCRTESRF